MKVRSPSRLEDLGLSIPRRLIAMLLRRELLRDHITVDSVIKGQESLLAIKDTSREHPIFLRAGASGLSLNNDNIPIRKTAFTSYFSLRAQWAGYPVGCCMYSWRSKASTNVRQASGIERARRFLAHGAQTDTLDEHYDEGLYDFDAVGVALGGQEERSVELGNFDAVVLYRTEPAKNNVYREAAIQNAVSRHLDVLAAATLSANELKMTKKWARKAAINACLAAERKEQRGGITVDDVRTCQAKLHEPSILFHLITKTMELQRPEEAGVVETDTETDQYEDEGGVAADTRAMLECGDAEEMFGVWIALFLHVGSLICPRSEPHQHVQCLNSSNL